METKRKYQFSWALLGNIDLGRPNLGHATRLEVYRLMQFCFRDIMEQHLGTEKTDQLFYEAGKLAGSQFHKHVIGHTENFDEFIKKLQDILKEMGVGVLRIEQADLQSGSFVLTVSEDLDCSGLPELDYEICTYDEGFISGLLETSTGKRFVVKEVDCWCTGDVPAVLPREPLISLSSQITSLPFSQYIQDIAIMLISKSKTTRGMAGDEQGQLNQTQTTA